MIPAHSFDLMDYITYYANNVGADQSISIERMEEIVKDI